MGIVESDVFEIFEGLPNEVRSRLHGKRFLITGAAGFLGQYLIEVGRRTGRSCTGLDLRGNGADIIEHDATKPLGPLGSGAFDFIIHAAGNASPAVYKAKPFETLEVSYTGTKNVLEVARQNPGCRVLICSSSEVYATPPADMIPTPEDYVGQVASMSDRSVYDVGKLVSETLAYAYRAQFGVDVIVVRPFNSYGPGLALNDFRIMANIATAALKKESVHLYGDGNRTRTYCYATDTIRGILYALALGKAGEVYNVGSDGPEVTLKTLIDTASKAVGFQIDSHISPYPAHYPSQEPQRRCPDITKLRELGFEPRVSLESGIRRYVDWARKQ